MRRISAYSINLLFLLISSIAVVSGQDTLQIPLKIRAGMEVSGPVIYFTDKNILQTEGYIAVDLNEKRSVVLNAGYLNYKSSLTDYNKKYEYHNSGFFLKTGFDFNLLKPQKSMGKYWAGVGLRYGLSVFNSEIPVIEKLNYWGTNSTSVASQTSMGHFFEVTPGVRAEIFRNISIGWSISLRKLIYTGSDKDLKPMHFPGYGNTGKSIATGVSYFLTWNIPYKKIRVIIKKEEPEDTEDSNESDDIENSGNTVSPSRNTGTKNSTVKPSGNYIQQ